MEKVSPYCKITMTRDGGMHSGPVWELPRDKAKGHVLVKVYTTEEAIEAIRGGEKELYVRRESERPLLRMMWRGELI